jgi:hypothetical protein
MRKTLMLVSMALGLTAAVSANLAPMDGSRAVAVKTATDLDRQFPANDANAPEGGQALPVLDRTSRYDYPTVEIGDSRYDYQHNGSYGKMIAVSVDGIAHAAFMGGSNTSTLRRVRATCVDTASPEVTAGPLNVVDQHSGYNTVAVTSEAPENGVAANSTVVAFHTSAPATSWFGIDFDGCTMAFANVQHDQTNSDILWPHVVVDYIDKVHITSGDASTGPLEDAVWYDASTDGMNFDGEWRMVTDNSNTLSATMAAAKHAPGVAVIFMQDAPAAPNVFYEGDNTAVQWHHDIFYYEARDANNDLHAVIAGGEPVNITKYYDPASEAPFAYGTFAYADMDGIYDSQATPDLHIAFSAPMAFADSMLYEDLLDGVTYFTPWSHIELGSALWHYNATTGVWGHIAGNYTGPDGDHVNPDPGVFRISRDRVQLAHDPETGYLYAIWNAYTDDDRRDAWTDDKLMPNGEIWAACSADNGDTWGEAVNLTNTQTPDCVVGECDSETFASMAELVYDGHLHIMFMNDLHAGSFIRATDANDGSAETVNPYYYMKVPVEAVPPHDGTPWNADGHIGLSAYSRQWWFTNGHPDTMRMIDKVDIWNEGPQDRHVTMLTMYHDILDEFGTENLWVTWEVMPGSPITPSAWIVDPSTGEDWDGYLPSYQATMTHLSVGHQGLPLREQAFKFDFSDGSSRVYRFEYRPAEGGDPLVQPIDLDNLEQYASMVLYENEVSVAERNTPVSFALAQNYPNPFNPTTEIRFELQNAAQANLAVYNLMGEKVAVLVDGPLASGAHQVVFNAEGLPSGVYFYSLEAGGVRETRKMLLTK